MTLYKWRSNRRENRFNNNPSHNIYINLNSYLIINKTSNISFFQRNNKYKNFSKSKNKYKSKNNNLINNKNYKSMLNKIKNRRNWIYQWSKMHKEIFPRVIGLINKAIHNINMIIITRINIYKNSKSSLGKRFGNKNYQITN